MLGIAAAAGAALWRLGNLEARMKALEEFRGRTGERVGKLEEGARHLRRMTAPAGHQVDAGGRVLAPIDGGESSA